MHLAKSLEFHAVVVMACDDEIIPQQERLMRKQTIQYTSPRDALIAVTKRLSTYESQQQMDSEEFFDQYSRGQLSDDAMFVEWANDYRHYLELRQKLEKSLQDVA